MTHGTSSTAIAQGELGLRDAELALGFAALLRDGVPERTWDRTTAWRRRRVLERLGVELDDVDVVDAYPRRGVAEGGALRP